MRRSMLVPFLSVFLVASNPFHAAWAYLDPGTGSMILQLLLGGIAGAVVVIKLYWHRFVSLFKGKSSSSSNSESSESD